MKHGDGLVQQRMKIGAHFTAELGAVLQSMLMTGNRVMEKHQVGEFLKPNALALLFPC